MTRVDVQSAAQMAEVVLQQIGETDVLIGVVAFADWLALARRPRGGDREAGARMTEGTHAGCNPDTVPAVTLPGDIRVTRLR